MRWQIRDYEVDESDIAACFDVYFKHPSLFTIKLHHGGSFSKYPGRQYVGGTFIYVDEVDCDYFSVFELEKMLTSIGYDVNSVMYYHFKKPGTDFDYGLLALANDQDVMNLVACVEKSRLIGVYIEHGITTVFNYWRSPTQPKVVIEEIDEEPVDRKCKKKVVKKCRKKLLLGWKIFDDEGECRVVASNVNVGVKPNGDVNMGDEFVGDVNIDDRLDDNVNTDDRLDDNVSAEDRLDDNLNAEDRLDDNLETQNELEGDPEGGTETNHGLGVEFENEQQNELHDVEVDMTNFNFSVEAPERSGFMGPAVGDIEEEDEVVGLDFDDFDSGNESDLEDSYFIC